MNLLKANDMSIARIPGYYWAHFEPVRPVEQTNTLPIPGEYLQLNTDSGKGEKVGIRKTAFLQPRSGKMPLRYPLAQV